MTTTEPKHRTITLTDRPPVRIREDQWPRIASGDYKDWDNQYESQANRTWKINIRVRQHADGRAIVYGTYEHDTQFQNENGETHRVGLLIEPGDDLSHTIKQAVEQLTERVSDEERHRHIRDAGNECIADLPAETLE